jgi:uncharacterized membrane protein
VRRREDLGTPRPTRNRPFEIHYDPEAFGRFSEAVARTLGTARYLVWQTAIIVVWIAFNAVSWDGQFDEYPFILLTLALSMQASYAAPLILLAQDRQADRDRAQSEADRNLNERTQAEAEFVAREIAGIRLALSDVVTSEDLQDAVRRLTTAVEALAPSILAPVDLSSSPHLEGEDDGERVVADDDDGSDEHDEREAAGPR